MAETENPVMFVVYPIGKKASKFAQKLVGDNVEIVTADEMTAKRLCRGYRPFYRRIDAGVYCRKSRLRGSCIYSL